MRILKTNALLRLANSYIVDSPQPANLSYMWNFGSLLALCLIIQILSGVFLAMHYTPSVDMAFNSVEHIMRDVNNGWIVRYTHANVASFFFICVYLHVARGLYYGSFKSPRVLVWSIGVIILVLMMAIAFLGLNVSPKCSDATRTVDIFNFLECSVLTSIRLQAILQKHQIKPFAVFENLHIEGAKALAYKFLKPFSGVYLIVNLENGDCYVGSAITGNLHKRLHKHLFGLSGSKHLGRAVTKYELKNFAFVILETMSGKIDSNRNPILLDMENKYIELLKPKYNKSPVAGNTFGFRHSDETKIKMRANYSNERREKIGSLNKGKSLSADTKTLLKNRAIARKPFSLETRALISEKSANVKFFVVSKFDESSSIDNAAVTLRSIPVVAEYCGCSERTIRRALVGNGIVKRTWRVSLAK